MDQWPFIGNVVLCQFKYNGCFTTRHEVMSYEMKLISWLAALDYVMQWGEWLTSLFINKHYFQVESKDTDLEKQI